MSNEKKFCAYCGHPLVISSCVCKEKQKPTSRETTSNKAKMGGKIFGVKLIEGRIKKGGVNPDAPDHKPNFIIHGQKPV
jgi:hypothetical protein